MTSIATSLSRALPKPKYTGEDEELPAHAKGKGPRVLGAGSLEETQLVIKVNTTLCNNMTSLTLLRGMDPLPMVKDQDGDPAQRRTMAMAARFPKSPLHSIHWTWAASPRRRPTH